MSVLLLMVLLSLGSALGFPYRKSVNPCGIAYDQLGSERYRTLHTKRALISRIREIMPLLNVTFPKEFSSYKMVEEAWIPDSNTIDGSLHFSKQIMEINRNLKYFSCAFDILEKDLSHMIATCRYGVHQFNHLVRNHRLLVCETDAVMGILGIRTPVDYPALTVEVPSDWYISTPDCTQSGFIISVVYNKYKCFLEAFLSILESTRIKS